QNDDATTETNESLGENWEVQRDLYLQFIQQISRLNSLDSYYTSPQLGFPKTTLPEQKTPDPKPEVPAALTKIYELLSLPAVQGYLRLFENADFRKGVNELILHPRLNLALYWELGLLISILL